MGKGAKRPRTERRIDERAARELVRQKQKLALLSPGGSAERPIEVPASPVIEVRAGSLPCPLCGGHFTIDDHQAPNVSLRTLAVTCQQCGVARTLWFRITTPLAN